MSEDRPAPSVRPARADETLDVRRLLDASMLEVAAVEDRIATDEVLVAVEDGTVCGAIVVAPSGPPSSASAEESTQRAHQPCPRGWRERAHVRGIVVRRRRRNGGVGTALVRAATARYGPLVADFGDDVRPFYESLGAVLEATAGDRWWALVPER